MLDGRGYGLKIEQREGTVFASMAAMPKELAQEFKVVWVEGQPRCGHESMSSQFHGLPRAD